MLLTFMLVAGQFLVSLEASGYQPEEGESIIHVRQVIQDAYKQEEVKALTNFIIKSQSFRNLLNKNVHEANVWLTIRKTSYKTFQEFMFSYCKDIIQLNEIDHLMLAINAFIDYWPNREINTEELNQPLKYTKEGFSKPNYHLKMLEFIRSPENRLSFVNNEFIRKFQDKELAYRINNVIDNRIRIIIQNNLNYNDERLFYEKIFRLIDNGDFQQALENYEDWFQETNENYNEVVEYISKVLDNNN